MASSLACVGLFASSCVGSGGGGGGGGGDADVDTDSDTDGGGDCDTNPTRAGCPCDGLEPELCYTGPIGTRDIGICASGVTTCDDGEWGPCAGQTMPSVESAPINGRDDDCDGYVDDGLCDAISECNGSCCTELQECYKGRCRKIPPDPGPACDDEESSATVCYYYGGGHTCTSATDEVCDDGDGAARCFPDDMCDDCCDNACTQPLDSCGYRY